MLQVSQLSMMSNFIAYLFHVGAHQSSELPNRCMDHITVTVAFEFNGVQLTMLLDIIEVAKSHSGINLAAAFVKILDDFGISDKVGHIIQRIMNNKTH